MAEMIIPNKAKKCHLFPLLSNSLHSTRLEQDNKIYIYSSQMEQKTKRKYFPDDINAIFFHGYDF